MNGNEIGKAQCGGLDTYSVGNKNHQEGAGEGERNGELRKGKHGQGSVVTCFLCLTCPCPHPYIFSHCVCVMSYSTLGLGLQRKILPGLVLADLTSLSFLLLPT